MNIYLRDAGVFLREASKTISDTMEKAEIIQATMNCALGLERVLKGVLFEINPTYILIDPTFNSSIQVLYKQKLIADKEGHNELNKNPNADVITFRISLLRAQAISLTTFNNKNLLFAISNTRDIIAHNDLTLLDLQKLALLLKRDYYQLITDYCSELSISKSKYFDGQQIRLSELASKYNEDIGKKLELMFVAHKERWTMLGQTEGYKENKETLTDEILSTPGKFVMACPACGNRAVIYTKQIREFNKFENRDVVVGVKVNELKCRFCKLDVKDYKELDFLKLETLIKQENTSSE